MLTLAKKKKDLTKEKKNAKTKDKRPHIKRETQFQKKQCSKGHTVCHCMAR